MLTLAFFLKTYRNDRERVERLIDSYRKYNEDKIKLFLMCPNEDVELFKSFGDENIAILSEDEIKTEIFTKDANWTAGYLNQEIYKLAFWELGLCDNYLCLDSDGLFIRPFFIKDFMFDSNTPYTVLVEDNDLRADLYYNQLYWNGRMEWLKKVEDTLDFHPYKLMTCHGFQIFSSKVLSSLKKDFMDPKGYTYKDLIEIAPFEVSWYNMWLQKTECMPIRFCEPLFKTIHLKQHHINEVLRGMTIDDWAKGYIGIVVNSNYGVGTGIYEDMSVYSIRNAGLPESIVINNYEFYRRLKKDRIIRRIRNVCSGIKRKAKTFGRS